MGSLRAQIQSQLSPSLLLKTSDKKQAVSLQYSGKGAPTVTAKGEGYIAEQILELAAEHNIPITQDKELVSLLSQIEIDQEIPEVLYEAVAQVLIFAYELSGKSLPKPTKD